MVPTEKRPRSSRTLNDPAVHARSAREARARSARGGARSAPRRHLAIPGGAKKSSIFQGGAENFGDETKRGPPELDHRQCRDGTRVPSMDAIMRRNPIAATAHPLRQLASRGARLTERTSNKKRSPHRVRNAPQKRKEKQKNADTLSPGGPGGFSTLTPKQEGE